MDPIGTNPASFVIRGDDGQEHTENTAAISTPCADAEKARARYMVHMFVACLLSQRPTASTREIRAAIRAARALF